MPVLPLSRDGLQAIDVAMHTAREAGDLLLKRLPSEKQVTMKGRGNIVTDVDREVEELVIKRLLDAFPGFQVLAEESGKREGASELAWVIDPLDGTKNYASGIPFFAVNIALARGNDVLAGVTFDPNRGELFHAEKGKGAFLNGTRLRPSIKTTLQSGVLGTDMGYSDKMGHFVLHLMDSLWPGMQGLRIMGSAALGLAYAAAGRVDIYFHHFLSPWDIAPGILFNLETGNTVTNGAGTPVDYRKDSSIVACNPAMHADFMGKTAGHEWRVSRS
jgi:myo-inositol-1(or 4)-monophosphatase